MIGCCCPACGDLSLKRQRMKRLLADLELEHPDIKNSMIKALSNVCQVICWIAGCSPLTELACSGAPARLRP